MMARSIPELTSFISEVERVAGPEVAATVVGESVVDSGSKPKDRALWLAAAIKKLRGSVDPEAYRQIMRGCGAQCARQHRAVKTTLERRRKYQSLEEFLLEEQKDPPAGTRLVVEGRTIYQYYSPTKAKERQKCFCPVMRHLPETKTAPSGYCECSGAYLETVWSAILGEPAKVEVLETCLTGAQECVFRIRPKNSG